MIKQIIIKKVRKSTRFQMKYFGFRSLSFVLWSREETSSVENDRTATKSIKVLSVDSEGHFIDDMFEESIICYGFTRILKSNLRFHLPSQMD